MSRAEKRVPESPADKSAGLLICAEEQGAPLRRAPLICREHLLKDAAAKRHAKFICGYHYTKYKFYMKKGNEKCGKRAGKRVLHAENAFLRFFAVLPFAAAASRFYVFIGLSFAFIIFIGRKRLPVPFIFIGRGYPSALFI